MILFSQSSWAKENKFFNKKNILVIGLTIVNPAISLGTIVTNAGALRKTLSMVNIAYSAGKGKNLAEQAISKSTNKNCLIKNLAEEKSFCS
jgi:hypothetical protein|tara:strand:+ start:305 stop:577 length:273 start_codon:yes stop_codon:yes gene_type:complete